MQRQFLFLTFLSFPFSKIDIFLKTKINGFCQPKYNYYEQLSTQNIKITLVNSIDTLYFTFSSCLQITYMLLFAFRLECFYFHRKNGILHYRKFNCQISSLQC